MKKECNLIKHAKREFEVLGWPGDCEMQKMICDNLLELIKVFSDQGHSGSSGSYLISRLTPLLNFEPMSPLTGEDSEWNEIGEGIYQNNRCGRVFKDEDGRAYDIDGKVFIEPSGACFTSIDSRVYVEFPYVPKTEYVDLEEPKE